MIITAYMVFLMAGVAPVPFTGIGTCQQEAAKLDLPVVCVQTVPITDSQKRSARQRTEVVMAEYRRINLEIEKEKQRWANTDRVWCGLIETGSNPDNRRLWPHGVKPGPCPK